MDGYALAAGSSAFAPLPPFCVRNIPERRPDQNDEGQPEATKDWEGLVDGRGPWWHRHPPRPTAGPSDPTSPLPGRKACALEALFERACAVPRRWADQGRQESARARGQTLSAKKRHEDGGPGQASLRKGFEGRFPTEGVADEHDGKIAEIVVAKAGSGKPSAFLKGWEQTSMSEDRSHRCHFCHPGRG